MWHDEGLYHLRSAIRASQRNSLFRAYCFFWDEKSRTAHPVPPKSRVFRTFQLCTFSLGFIFFPIILLQCYRLVQTAPIKYDTDHLTRTYFTFLIALLAWMIIPFSRFLSSPSCLTKFVNCYEALTNLEKRLQRIHLS